MRRTISLIIVFMLMVASTCLAKDVDVIYHDDHVLSPTEVAIGGVCVGMSENEVRKIYGAPTYETEYKPDYMVGGKTKTIKYGDSFIIAINDGYVLDITSNAHNGLKTPSGIQVGDIKAKILPAYGKPWRYFESSKDYSSHFVYKSSDNVHLAFVVKGGVITNISIIGYE